MGIDNEQYSQEKGKKMEGENNQSYLLRSCLESGTTKVIKTKGPSPFRHNQRWGP